MNMSWYKKVRHSFSEDERGSLLIFVLVVFSGMFLVGGTAVDLARHETLRSTMQYNLDRAVLAAASLKQTQEPDDVVNDYMSKVDTIEDFTVVVNSDVGVNYRSVSATATADLDTWFLGMAGINEMSIETLSAAEEKIPKLEVSLVLDVSGSMGSNSKLSNLKTAAKEFVTTMLTAVEDDTVAISIVPFNNGVAPSDTMFESMNIDVDHNYSTCLEFTDAEFSDVKIDPNVTQTQAVYTSLYIDNSHDDHLQDGWEQFDDGSRTCYTDDWFQILPYSDNETALHNKIDSLEADGWTAGHLGIKWGAALLDPAFNDVTTDLIAALEVDSGFSNIPVAYTDHETLKVIIMMGDGANTYEFLYGTDFRGAGSDVWRVDYTEQTFDYAYHKYKAGKTSNKESKCSSSKWVCVYTTEDKTNYFVRKPSNNNYYDIEEDDWLSNSEFTNLPSSLEGWQSSTQLSWEDAWGHMSAEWYDWVTEDWNDNAFDDLVYGTARSGSEADTVMEDICDAARDAGMILYTIGFETSDSTSEKLEDCASSAGHYYDAEGTEISYVFAAIAASIQKLKLTQ